MYRAINICICDDHTIFRKGLAIMLKESSAVGSVVEFSNGEELLNNLKNISADVILLDINMDGRNGIDILKQIKSSRPSLKVIILSMNSPQTYGIRAMKAGANSYLQKTVSEDELIKAIEEVMKGNRYITQELGNLLLKPINGDQDPLKLLTDRELEVLTLFAQNMSNQQISKRLNLSPKTVSTHKRKILDKLDIQSINEACELIDIV